MVTRSGVLLALLMFGTLTVSAQAELVVGERVLVGTQRVSRVVFEYTFRVELTNTGPAVQGATGTVTSTSPSTVITDDAVTFGDVAAGATVLSADTFAFRQDRRFAFDPATLVWDIQAQAADTTPPQVAITDPAPLSLFNTSPIEVSGSVDDASATVEVNGVAALVVPGAISTFTALVPIKEGNNALTAVATDPAGNVGTAAIQVTLDTSPPRVTIDSPADGLVTSSATVTVAGMINDTVVGTVNGDQAQVTVNGVPAQVANRSYLAPDVSLSPGANLITAVGKDRAGNAASAQITVVREDIVGEPQITMVSGNNQHGPIGAELPAPLVVELSDAAGAPAPGKTVIFEVVQNNGSLRDSPGGGSLAATTDAQGRAQASWTLGTRFGAGNNKVIASAVGFAGDVVFTATAEPGAPAKINVDAGNSQVGVAGQPLPHPLVAVVTDAGHNRLHGVPVTFTVVAGGGSFGGQPTFTGDTDSDGRVLATLTLGPGEGYDNNRVEVGFVGLPGAEAIFVASGKEAGDPDQTRVTGVVLDNTNLPIPGVTLHIEGTALAVQSDEQGQFVLDPAPIGKVHLVADGSTAQRPGIWPTLMFEMVTIAGRDNTLGMPVYLLPIDVPGGLFVDETHGGTLTLPEVPGFALTIAPGTATFPDGSRSGVVSVTVVHPDHVPMTPGFGQQPRFIVTIQPPGVLFEPPAPLTLPNADGLAPREVTDLYSFDHDLGQFVSIGTGSVSDDGSVIVSDPGVGIIKGGWHCGGNPTAFGTCEHECDDGNPCTDDKFVNGMCEHTPKEDGTDCSEGNKCIKNATCMAGKCGGEPNLNVAGSDADKATFMELLRKCGKLDKIGDHCDPGIDVNLGRDNGFIDGFNSKKVDLTDLEFVAGDHPCAWISDECQNLAHILGERDKAKDDGCNSAADPCFMDAHGMGGWGAENDYRMGTGKTGTILSDSNCPGVDFCIRYDDDGDGMEDRREEWDLDGGKIVSRKCVP